ncbi:DNA/RNA polymerase superfamily protein [Pleurotus pulmonarius]
MPGEDMPWSDAHQQAFDGIKSLVASRECLTVIDHEDPGENRIFVTTDASDLGTGAVLSFGKDWKTARPVAFESKQLSPAKKNYPTHEKEMLAIVRALHKWRNELLGAEFQVFTDHRTLEFFNQQRNLSKKQLRWQEFLADFNFTINYVCGEDNTVADTLSRQFGDEPVVAPVT